MGLIQCQAGLSYRRGGRYVAAVIVRGRKVPRNAPVRHTAGMTGWG